MVTAFLVTPRPFCHEAEPESPARLCLWRWCVKLSVRAAFVGVVSLLLSSIVWGQAPAQIGNIYVGVCDGSGTQLNETDVYTSMGGFVNAFHGPAQAACTTGMTFDISNHLRVISAPLGNPSWSVNEFDAMGTLLSNKGPFPSPVSIAHDNQGNLYLGQGTILKIAPNGATTTYTVAGGAQWISLSTDQHTMFYTAANGDVKSYDLSTRTQGIDLAVGAMARTVRTLADNTILIDVLGAIQHWVPACVRCAYKQVFSYQIPANADSLALDPDGVSFWTINTYVDIQTHQGMADVYRTDIKTGDPLGGFSLQPLSSGRYYSMSIGVNGDGSTSVLGISPSSLTYPARLIGTVSGGKKIALTNTGGVQIVLNNVTITGDFTIKKNGCVKGISPGATCSISVTFTPTQKGTRTGILRIFDNAITSPQTVSLSGVGK